MTGVIDRERAEQAVRELLRAIGENPDRKELAETPSRVVDAYTEFFAGVGTDPLPLLADAIPAASANSELVLVRDIVFRSLCEHHLLPFRGVAHIAYRPAAKLAGLGALPRVLGVLAARPQLQERLGEQFAEVCARGLEAAGVLVVLEAAHSCVADRGVKQMEATAVTIAARGFFSKPEARAEVLSLLGSSRRAERS